MSDFPIIPGCRIISLLGKGGVAAVYLGVQEKLFRKVAIKVLDPSLLHDRTTAARFEKEAKIVAGLSHSNIVQIFDTGNNDDYNYIVMEYLNDSLRDRLKRNQGKLPPHIALEIVEKIMKALDYAHFQGVYHRDIKPGNIMFRQDSIPVLVDFGMAGLFNPNELTKIGTSLGTSEYMSPEQCKTRKDIDGRSDIYSLGVILYEMLTGKRPYNGNSHIEVALQHIEEPLPKLPKEYNRFQPLIDRMMAKDRENRLVSAVEFENILYSIISRPTKSASKKVDSTTKSSTNSQLKESAEPTTSPQNSQDLIANKPGEAAKQLSKVYLNILKEKLFLFFTFLKELITNLFNKYKDFMNPRLKSFKKDSVMDKTKTMALGASPLMVAVLLVVLIVAFGKSSDSGEKDVASMTGQNQTIAQPDALTTEQKKKQEIVSKYEQVMQLLENGEHKKVRPIIIELTAENTQDIKGLEEIVNNFKDQIYKRALSDAESLLKEGYLLRARDCLLIAQDIKKTNELIKLKREINLAISKSNPDKNR